jgi:glycosyltransferase involved in cell wall biosynthesis
MGPAAEVLIAPDLAPASLLKRYDPSSKSEKRSGSCRISYLSRIVPNKNLKFLLECLGEIREGRIELEIIGPHEDPEYWAECERLIANLPSNITARVLGPLPNNEALARLAASHFLALPTQNENFGYVFLEALAMGCPILATDRTIWNDVAHRDAGWCVPLDDRPAYIERLEESIAISPERYAAMSAAARRYAEEWLSSHDTVTVNRAVLETALGRPTTSQFASA